MFKLFVSLVLVTSITSTKNSDPKQTSQKIADHLVGYFGSKDYDKIVQLYHPNGKLCQTIPGDKKTCFKGRDAIKGFMISATEEGMTNLKIHIVEAEYEGENPEDIKAEYTWSSVIKEVVVKGEGSFYIMFGIRRLPNLVYVRQHPFDFFENEMLFQNRYRCIQDVFNDFYVDVEPHMETDRADKGDWATTKMNRLLMTIRYLASNGVQTLIADVFGVCQSTVSIHIDKVINVLSSTPIQRRYLRFPVGSPTFCQRTADNFCRMADLPNIIGSIDGTYIPTSLPTTQSDRYRGRKGVGLNVLIVADAEGRILYVNARFGASYHDSYIWSRSELKYQYDVGNFLDGYYLIGDKGFANQSSIIVPYPNNNNDPKCTEMNKKICQTRVSVESALGRLKERFKILKTSMRFNHEKNSKVVIACCVMHNYLLEKGYGRVTQMRIPVPLIPPPANHGDPREFLKNQL